MCNVRDERYFLFYLEGPRRDSARYFPVSRYPSPGFPGRLRLLRKTAEFTKCVRQFTCTLQFPPGRLAPATARLVYGARIIACRSDLMLGNRARVCIHASTAPTSPKHIRRMGLDSSRERSVMYPDTARQPVLTARYTAPLSLGLLKKGKILFLPAGKRAKSRRVSLGVSTRIRPGIHRVRRT